MLLHFGQHTNVFKVRYALCKIRSWVYMKIRVRLVSAIPVPYPTLSYQKVHFSLPTGIFTIRRLSSVL